MGHSNINQDIVPNQHPFGANCDCALLSDTVGVPQQSQTQQGRADEEGLQSVGNFRLGVRSAARKGELFYGLGMFIALLSS